MLFNTDILVLFSSVLRCLTLIKMKKRFLPTGRSIAGDRVVEYSFWIVYTYVNVIPLFVLLIIVLRHSFVDALMGSKGTSSKMKTKFGNFMYASTIGRGGINVLKFLTFSYLAFVYIWNAPLIIGYILTAALVLYIMLRGLAEIMESK